MLEQLKNKLSDLEGSDLCLLLSGGKDSRLLLEAMISLKMSFSVLRFDDGWTREQRSVVDELIKRYGLRVYSYPPTYSIMVGRGDGELAVISGYAFDRETLPFIRDIVDGERCGLDVAFSPIAPRPAPLVFDTYIVGTKKGETHFAVAPHEFLQADEWVTGGSRFITPLYDFSDADVIAALAELGVDWQEPSDEKNSGNVVACTSCFHGVADVYCPKTGGTAKPLDWDPQGNLLAWRQQMGLEA